MKINSKIVLTILGMIVFSIVVKSQNAAEVFGKNKVQYNEDQYDWWIYETNNFVYYWYGKSKNPAQFIIEIAESENNYVQKLFEYHLKDKIEIIVYADASDHAQSNIDLTGIINDKNWNASPKIKEQKILLYFTGNHQQLKKDLRAGIIQIYFNSMFSGTALQEVVQKVISLKLPEWFEKGLIEYLTEGWSKKDQYELTEKWKQKNFKKFSSKYPELAGKSFWNFLTYTYGEQSISNWLYMTRIQKELAQAAQAVFSQSFTDLQMEWYNFYKNINSGEHNRFPFQKANFKLHPEEKITDVNTGEESNQIILSTHQNGKGRILSYNIIEKLKKRKFKKGSRSKLYQADLNYPIYAHLQEDDKEYFFYEKRNRVHLRIMDTKSNLKQNHRFPEDIQRIYAACILNKNEMLFSANNSGYSDIFIFNIKTRQYKKLTDDIWDDLAINKTSKNSKIYFCSNRPDSNTQIKKVDSILPLGNFKLFELDLSQETDKAYVKKLVDIPDYSIETWKEFNSDILIKAKHGIETTWFLYKDNQLQNFNFELLPDFIYPLTHEQSVLITPIKPSAYEFKTVSTSDLNLNPYVNHNLISSQLNENEIPDTSIKKDTAQITFQSKFGDPPSIKKILSEFYTKRVYPNQQDKISPQNILSDKYPNIIDFNSNLAIAYRKRFTIEELSSTINNEVLFSGLNTFSGSATNYEPPSIGILLKAKISEIFENHSLEGGIRIPTNFNGIESYVLFENRIKRMDQSYAVYYKTNTELSGNGFGSNLKKQTNIILLNHQLKYALDHYNALKVISTIRNDHTQYLSTNPATLEDSVDQYQQRIGSRLEYVYDNSIDVSLNIRNGWQAKFFLEFSKRFALNPQDKNKFYPGSLWLTGFDIRYHLPVLKKSVFSNRIYSNISFGKEKILYHVGGTENWLLPKYEEQNALQTKGSYVYSALATEVRSYGYGALKAGSVCGISTELRIPFLQYLLSQNWKNSILRNFQLIPFVDAAFVWDGFIPDFKNSSTLDYHAENPAVIIDLQYTRKPYIAGTGYGLRTSLFGYYIRFDQSWKLNDVKKTKANYSFSLGLDF